MKLSSRNRLKWIKKQIERSQVLKAVMPLSLGRYQKIIFILLKRRHINLAILIMHIKIIIEKNGGLDVFRRV